LTTDEANLVLNQGSRYTVADFAGDEGYESMEMAGRYGWHAISSWGHDGWDLGAWPLVIIFVRNRASEVPGSTRIPFDLDRRFEVCEYVEGDLTVWAYATEAERDWLIDRLAAWHWKGQGEAWATDIDPEHPPERLRGPYRPNRDAPP
jgi:hypothetical protein